MNKDEEIKKIDSRLEELPKGTLTYKAINGKKQPYLQRTIDGRSVSYYIKVDERQQVLAELEERQQLLNQRKRLVTYGDKISEILKNNPYLDKKVGIGWQEFERVANGDIFYVDKTDFIRQWWESPAQVSLIVRPRRFGKTLALTTVESFFSTRYAGQSSMFENLHIWKHERYHKLQGTYPVIFVTLLSAKGRTFQSNLLGIEAGLQDAYSFHDYLESSDKLSEEDKREFKKYKYGLWDYQIEDSFKSIQLLSKLLFKHYGKRVIILLDEYDTPVLEGYASGYLDEALEYIKLLINSTFKRNRYLERAIITGTTKIVKNSLFSDMNNIEVVTGNSDEYSDMFGFTEQEVRDGLKCQNNEEMEMVKFWYDGFNFGNKKNIYNPWSITKYIKSRVFEPYWINTSSNTIIGELMRGSSKQFKLEMELLLKRESIYKEIDENMSFKYLSSADDAIWSLLLSLGYITADNMKRGELISADFRITNYETLLMFRKQAIHMLDDDTGRYNYFVKYLLSHKMEELNDSLNTILINSVSFFDTPNVVSKGPQENFYHGLVLGLIASLHDSYHITSNRESGYGRYDIAMVPFDKTKDAFIMEFKVFNERKEKTLEDTVKNALNQIEEKNYEAEILAQGIPSENIYKMGFGFDKKEALVIDPKCPISDW